MAHQDFRVSHAEYCGWACNALPHISMTPFVQPQGSVPVFPSQLESYGFSFPNADVGVVKTSLQVADLDCLGTAHALYRRSSASHNIGRGVIAPRPGFVGPSPSLILESPSWSDIGTKLRAPFSIGLFLDSALPRAFGRVSKTTIPYQDRIDKGNVDGTKLAMVVLS
jgi:hypothetical protein